MEFRSQALLKVLGKQSQYVRVFRNTAESPILENPSDASHRVMLGGLVGVGNKKLIRYLKPEGLILSRRRPLAANIHAELSDVRKKFPHQAKSNPPGAEGQWTEQAKNASSGRFNKTSTVFVGRRVAEL